ncbi:hypothetical protein WOLCODRAFT_165223 [Wolfiporia cocos MD-104 SS10]|uniref:Spermatogenesis-associated protein 20-like TRX domain-containing protein n=1 Tax=Wolfiporia cocos (strain MD-104) TaxID=742152 RepID=A0A2H3K7W8_WOLCO|nr:hypothetical protein WOLCODRAFT_165223 [Wolfiporia cocos MD-104 SS10]
MRIIPTRCLTTVPRLRRPGQPTAHRHLRQPAQPPAPPCVSAIKARLSAITRTMATSATVDAAGAATAEFQKAMQTRWDVNLKYGRCGVSQFKVDWYEWGTEAFEEARRENKPICLSETLHATVRPHEDVFPGLTEMASECNVLAHESFEDEVMAKLMNDYFINIKVDCEERPDVDRLYMTFLQATNGGGGWPMSVCKQC